MAAISSTTTPTGKPAIGIISIGEMGLGVAKLLHAHDYTVLTVTTGRSQSTLDRIKSADIITLPTDEALVAESDIILSIVPPRDAVATARRIVDATRSSTAIKQRAERKNLTTGYKRSLVYIDMNAISPRTARLIASIFTSEASPAAVRRRTSSFSFTSSSADSKPLTIDFLDGGIIGPPPRPPPDDLPAPTSSSSSSSPPAWKLPSIIMSGPSLANLLPTHLQKTLNVTQLGPAIGTASTLKSCFASLTKGFTALSILSFTTAHTAGILPQLQKSLSEFAPALLKQAEGGLPGMPPKTYRWVDEMHQIGETFGDEGGLAAGPHVFDGIADLYRLVAEDSVLGLEKTERRKRGRTAEDVAACMADGVRKRRNGASNGGGGGAAGLTRVTSGTVVEEKDEDLSLTWRGSWS